LQIKKKILIKLNFLILNLQLYFWYYFIKKEDRNSVIGTHPFSYIKGLHQQVAKMYGLANLSLWQRLNYFILFNAFFLDFFVKGHFEIK